MEGRTVGPMAMGIPHKVPPRGLHRAHCLSAALGMRPPLPSTESQVTCTQNWLC